MARLVIRQDQEIQALRREDTVLYFFNSSEPAGALKSLVQAANTWKEQTQQHKQLPQWISVRQTLFQVLLKEVIGRLNELGTAAPTSELRQAALKNNVLLADMTCPYLEWDAHRKMLKVSQKPPITLKKMVANITELLDACRDQSLIKRFHALPPSAQSTVTPWLLQVSIRADQEYLLLHSLCHSGIWLLLGTSMKPHSQYQSNMATQLATALNLHKPKGQSKGHHKAAQRSPSKSSPPVTQQLMATPPTP